MPPAWLHPHDIRILHTSTYGLYIHGTHFSIRRKMKNNPIPLTDWIAATWQLNQLLASTVLPWLLYKLAVIILFLPTIWLTEQTSYGSIRRWSRKSFLLPPPVFLFLISRFQCGWKWNFKIETRPAASQSVNSTAAAQTDRRTDKQTGMDKQTSKLTDWLTDWLISYLAEHMNTSNLENEIDIFPVRFAHYKHERDGAAFSYSKSRS